MNKQQTVRDTALTGDAAVVFEELKSVGFDGAAARWLATNYPAGRVMRQVELIGKRTAKHNRLGLLRRAIEEDWSAPSVEVKPNYGRPKPDNRSGLTDLSTALERWTDSSNTHP